MRSSAQATARRSCSRSARAPGREETALVYPADPVAQKHGAGVAEETAEARAAYRAVHDPLAAYQEGWLPETRASRRGRRSPRFVAVTQDELYATLDLELSWSERALPENVRTKHVHRLHPYHGKFIPQLVEVLLERYIPRGGHVLDPFAGSGTTLVQALESGRDATGVELAAFNCLLIGVKTARYDLDALARRPARRVCAARRSRRRTRARPKEPYLQALVRAARGSGALRVPRPRRRVRARRRAARRPLARRALGAPRCALRSRGAARPADRRVLVPQAQADVQAVETAVGFLRRYTLDTLTRIEAFADVRDDERNATVLHGDSCEVDYADDVRRRAHVAAVSGPDRLPRAAPVRVRAARRSTTVASSSSAPPYAGTSRASLAAYSDGIARALANAASALAPGAPVLVVVNDRRNLYPEILDAAGLRLDARLRRHVNRRTGRRAGEYFEDVLVAFVNSP